MLENLREFLLYNTNVDDYVIIKLDGWRYGMAWVDPEDLFINSLSNFILDREIASVERDVQHPAFTKPVIIVDLK